MPGRKKIKWIVVSGGVLSGLGKGVVSASIGRLLKGYKVITIKCDGYLNIDPGTMNPLEHGEVFVLDDGGEVDMDFGHYERFMGISPKFSWNITSGKIFKSVIDKERRGDFLGKTVQFIPHVTDEIKSWLKTVAKKEEADIAIVEIGGTVGDLENRIFFEAVRQMKHEKEEIIFIHLTYVPFFEAVGELKTKPTQQSATLMMELGLQPDIIIARSTCPLDEKAKDKIALFCNVDKEAVISNPNIAVTYELPLIFRQQNLDKIIKAKLKLNKNARLDKWASLVNNMLSPKKNVNIAICGKYTALKDSYVSVIEALRHAGAHLNAKINIIWLDTTNLEEFNLDNIQGILIPGGFVIRGIEGKIKVIQYAREHKIPFLGLCLGMQLAVIEFARNVCGMDKANSTEFDEKTAFPVVDLLPGQKEIQNKGGTMRLGGHDVYIKPDTFASRIFKLTVIRRRFRHRYEINPTFVNLLENNGIIFSGSTKNGEIKQIVELKDHPFFMASQFHPEFTSALEKPDEMFLNFVKAALEMKMKERR